MIECALFSLKRMLPLVKLIVVTQVVILLGGEFAISIRGKLYPYEGFKLFSVSVPNHCFNENPIVHVTRSSGDYVKGNYRTHFENFDGTGAHVAIYQSEDFLYKKRKGSFFVSDLRAYFWDGNKRELPPGKWVGVVQHTFKRPYYSDTIKQTQTFPFEVWPLSDTRCRTVEK